MDWATGCCNGGERSEAVEVVIDVWFCVSIGGGDGDGGGDGSDADAVAGFETARGARHFSLGRWGQ
jgi:hypothetical protein